MMANILDQVKMLVPVSPMSGREAARAFPPIENVRNAVDTFLKNMSGAKQVCVTKLVVMDREKGIWEAEADVYVPNATIKALGLPVSKEVFDCRAYLLRLDEHLNVIAYGLRNLVDERE